MKNICIVSVIFTLLLISGSVRGSKTDSLNIAPFGKVYTYCQSVSPQNIIIMISGDGGWNYGVVDFARAFSEMNNLVIGVDIVRYYKDLRQRSTECYSVAADFVQLSTEIEKICNYPEYKPAVLIGYSSGATLVYGLLAQARPGTFIGGISLGFCTEIDLPRMLCQTNGLSEKTEFQGHSYLLQPDSRLGNRWIVLHGMLDKVCSFSQVADFVGKTADSKLVSLPDVGHGFSKWSDFMPQLKEAFKELTTVSVADSHTISVTDNIKDLPSVITNAKSVNKEAPIALLISGDGGWYSFEQQIADHLAANGISTIGLDSKKYFWKRKTPEEAAVDMTRLLSYYSRKWGNETFILIGYSLGAEIVPFILNRLSDEMRSKVISAVLLSPDVTTDFEIHISNMLGMGNHQNTYNVINEIKGIKSVRTLIILGDGEKSKVPGLLEGTASIIRMIPGDHHYKFNLPLIMRTMKENKTF